MMGRQGRDQGQPFYEFSLDEMIPTDHLLRRINVFARAVLADSHQQLRAFISDIGQPSVDRGTEDDRVLVPVPPVPRCDERSGPKAHTGLTGRYFLSVVGMGVSDERQRPT
jgi:hypothetical protein